MENVYILGGLRTPITLKNSKFKNMLPHELAAFIIRELVDKYKLYDYDSSTQRFSKCAVDGIIGGNAVAAGGNITRLAALAAKLPMEVPAITVDVQCASGASAIAMAYNEIACGNADVLLAGGMDSSSLQPKRTYSENDPRYSKTPNGDGEYWTAQFSPDNMNPDAMLLGAERVMQAEHMTAQELDEWVLRSHQLAYKAQLGGVLEDLILPINGIDIDEGVRPKMNQRLLDRMPKLLRKYPEFDHKAMLTAANSCLTNDGAAFVVLVSEKWMIHHNAMSMGTSDSVMTTIMKGTYRKSLMDRFVYSTLNLEDILNAPVPVLYPVARILGTAIAAGNPEESPRGAMLTADKLLKKLKLNYEDMAAIEFNEAFAAIDVLFERAHPKCLDKYNQLGGALAYGHPYGASGGILMLHLLRALENNDGRYGIMSIAGAGGMGQAIAVERID